MAQTVQELATIFATSVKKYYEPIIEAAAKLQEAKNYTDSKIAEVNASSTGITVDDNLTSTDATHALSAKQGQVLKGLVDALNTVVTSDDTSLDTIQEIVAYIKLNKSTLDTLGIAAITGLQAALDDKVSGSISQTQSDAAFNPA